MRAILIPLALAGLCQAVAGGLALDVLLAGTPLEFCQAALHRGLVDSEGTRGGDGAVVPCDGDEVLQVVPVKHRGYAYAHVMTAIMRLTWGWCKA